MNRRFFLKTGLTGLAGLSFPMLGYGQAKSALNTNSKKGIPIVIATWKNEKAVEVAANTLMKTGYALDAVEAGARVPEADPGDTSVGLGGLPDAEGNVTLDACIMDETGNAGAVTYLKNILHPVSVARKVMTETPHVMLSGDGALKFAREHGFEETNLLTDQAKKAWEEWKLKQHQPDNHDTIGILAIDSERRICGACTTSGYGFKVPGRVGDSPIIGAGLYVDNEVGAATATGLGELVMKTVGTFLIVELMRQGYSPQAACEEAVNRIKNKFFKDKEPDTQVGYLAINNEGEHGAFALLKGFNYAIWQANQFLVFDSPHL